MYLRLTVTINKETTYLLD